jgi:hypothetical protein
MTVPGNIDALLLGGEKGYKIERSLRFNSADSAYLNRTPASTTNRRTWTVSCWVKRTRFSTGTEQTIFGSNNGSTFTELNYLASSDVLRLNLAAGVATYKFDTSGVFRDPSAWYHIVAAVDTTQATAADRMKLYINGVQQTGSNDPPTQNYDTQWNVNQGAFIGSRTASTWFGNFYLTEFYNIDGQALTPSSFGETDTITGVWKPKKYAGTYGTNGFYLNFSDNSGTTSTTLGKDSSGNGNNWTPNNFSVTAGAGNDSLIDTPTPYADGGNGRGNYCTWLPQQGSQTWTFSNGNLDAVNGNAGSNAYSCVGTIAVSSGKWYWEVTVNDAGPTTLRVPGVGIMGSERNVLTTAATVRPDVYLSGNGTIDNSSGTALQSGFSNMAANDVVGVAVDADAKTVQFYRNGSAVGTAQSYSPATVTPSFYSYNTYDCNANFGQRPFAYTPPSGFVALNTQNLPEPSIKKPSSYFDVKLYTGTNATQSITGLNFSPDLVWLKNRSGTNYHGLFDTVRGRAAGLSSNVTDAESTSSAGNDLASFDANGFTVGPVQNWGSTNTSSASIVAWCWDESATPGFDIVTYTGDGVNGRQIPHNLGVKPKLIIEKGRGSTYNWSVQGCGELWTPATSNLFLNGTGGLNASGAYGAPTSTFFYPSLTNYANENGVANVAYLWSEVAGFSKFGSYTGNGSSDGPFCFCGFRPRFVMFKRTDSTGSWFMEDSARGTYNVMGPELYANLSDAETTVSRLDFLSNGFKMRAANAGDNASGGTYVFAAFSESPFKYSLAR